MHNAIQRLLVYVSATISRVDAILDDTPVLEDLLAEDLRSRIDRSEDDLWLSDSHLEVTKCSLGSVRSCFQCCLASLADRTLNSWDPVDPDASDIEEILADAECIRYCYDTGGMDPLNTWIAHYILLHFNDAVRKRWEEISFDDGSWLVFGAAVGSAIACSRLPSFRKHADGGNSSD